MTFFLPFVLLGTLQWWKSWNNSSKHHWRMREQERKEVSQCFYFTTPIELIWIWQLMVKGKRLCRRTLSLANTDISVNMDATFYLICFYMFQKCAFWTDKFVFYNLLHRGCKLYLLLGRKDYKRTLNVIKI